MRFYVRTRIDKNTSVTQSLSTGEFLLGLLVTSPIIWFLVALGVYVTYWYITIPATIAFIIALLFLSRFANRSRVVENKNQSKPINPIKEIPVPDVVHNPNLSKSLPNRLASKYSDRKENLIKTFPASGVLLNYPKYVQNKGLWFGTAVNAHLYRGNSYLSYIVLEHDSLVFKKQFNNRIANSTKDRSNLLFPILLRKIIEYHNGFQLKWAKEIDQSTFEIYSSAPQSFFNDFISEVESIKISNAA